MAHPLCFGGSTTTEGGPSLRSWQGWEVSVASAKFLSLLRSWIIFPCSTHDLRRGLQSFAAPRLDSHWLVAQAFDLPKRQRGGCPILALFGSWPTLFSDIFKNGLRHPCRVGGGSQAFDFAHSANKVGAPSLRFLQGRARCSQKRGEGLP